MKQPRAIITYVAILRNCLREYDDRLLARVRGERDKLTQAAMDLAHWAQVRRLLTLSLLTSEVTYRARRLLTLPALAGSSPTCPAAAAQSKAAELRGLLAQCEDESVVEGLDAESWRGIIDDNAAIANGPSRQSRRELHTRIVASAAVTSGGSSVELTAAAAEMEEAWTAMAEAEHAYDEALRTRLAAAEAAEARGELSPTRGAQDGARKPLSRGLSSGVLAISVLGKLRKNANTGSASNLKSNGSAGRLEGVAAEGRA